MFNTCIVEFLVTIEILNLRQGWCDSNIEFLYIIHSAPNHIGLRNALRSSWASTTIKNDLFQKVRRVFLIGRSNKTTEELNKKEHKKYGDIFMYDRVDAYRNMTIKV